MESRAQKLRWLRAARAAIDEEIGCHSPAEEWYRWWLRKTAHLGKRSPWDIWFDVLREEAPLMALDNVVAHAILH